MHDRPIEPDQRFYGRLAGYMYLLNYATFGFGVLVPPAIRGTGDLAEIAQRVLASEQLYRLALASLAASWVVLVVQNFALYVVLAPVNRRVARLALCLLLIQSAIGGVTAALSFAELKLYAAVGMTAPALSGSLQTTLATMRGASGNGFFILLLFFGCGSTLLFYLFHRSRYIPRPLAALGLAGSAIAFVVSLAALVFPNAKMLILGWAPIGVAELSTAFWLAFVGIRTVPVAAAEDARG